MDETTKAILLLLIGWAIYRHVTSQPLLPGELTTTEQPSGELPHEEEWEVVRTAENDLTKVIHRWR